jgi:cell division transport system permease protein
MTRIFINAFKNIRRAPYQSMAAVLILTISLFVTQVFVLILYTSQSVLAYFETRPQVTAFFKDEVSESVILNLKSQLENQQYVNQVAYVSKEEALKIYREQNSDDPLLLEMVTAEILPASLEVSAMTVDDLPIIAQTLEQTSGVEEVAFQTDVIDALKKWTDGIRTGGLIIVAFLAITSVLIISIIISIKASSKKHEIATLRLLGATPLYINGPFIVEGALYGLFGAVTSWAIIYIVILYSTPSLLNFFGEIPILPVDPMVMLSVLAGTAGLAMFMGMFSGSISTGRFGK